MKIEERMSGKAPDKQVFTSSSLIRNEQVGIGEKSKCEKKQKHFEKRSAVQFVV
jgi:hypothetical protein